MGIVDVIEQSISNAVGSVITFLPNLIAAIIVLIIFWIVGRWIAKIISTGLDKSGLDDLLRKTIIGKTIEGSGITIANFFDLIIRWFIYLIGIMAAVNILGIPTLSAFMEKVVTYLPNFIAGVAVLIIGFIVADLIGDMIHKTGESAGVAFVGIFSAAIKVFLYFVVIIMALDQLMINTAIIYTFATAMAWGIAIAIGIGVGIALGYGLKDKAPGLVDKIIGEETEQKLKRLDENLTK